MNNADGDGRRDRSDNLHGGSAEYDDEDYTARLGTGGKKPMVSTVSAASNNTVSALDRVKILAKRNQEVRHCDDMCLSWFA